MPRMFQSMFSCYRLGMAVVELPLGVDVQPTSGLIVLITLDVAGFPSPLVSRILVWQRNVERRVVPLVGFGDGL